MSGSHVIKIAGRQATVYRSGRGYVEVSIAGRTHKAVWHDAWPGCRSLAAPMAAPAFERYMDVLEGEAIALAREALREEGRRGR